MTAASEAAHGLLLQHVVTPDEQLPLPVDPAVIARVEGVDMPPVQNAYGRWEAAVALGRALEPDGAEFGWPGNFAYALLMPAEIIRLTSSPRLKPGNSLRRPDSERTSDRRRGG